MIVATGPTDDAAPRRGGFAGYALLTYGTQLAAAFLSLASVLIVARVLGPEGRGNVAFLTAIAILSGSLATLGVQEANVNLAAGEPRTRRALATNSVVLALVFGGAMIAILATLIAIFPAVAGPSDAGLRRLTFAFIPVLVLQILLRFIVQADYGFVVMNAAFILGPIVNVVANGTLALAGALSVETAVIAWLTGQTLEAVILAWYVQRRLAGFGRPNLALARRCVGFGVKAHIGRVMQLGNYRLDQWLLGSIAGARELGIYSVAVAWAEALWYLPTALAAVQRPDLIRADSSEAARQAARVFRAVVLFTAISGLLIVAAAPLLCVGLFGEEFEGSVGMLRVLVAAAFGVAAVKLLGAALVARGKPLLQSIAIGAGFLCTLTLDLLLIPPFGGMGAAVAVALAHTAAGLVVAVIFVRTLGGEASDLVPRPGDVGWFLRRLRERFRRPAATTA
jgi:O-antigen/teichoic acid export membrane protein